MAHDIVADLRTIRQGRAHTQIAIDASYLIDAEDEIVALRERTNTQNAEIIRLREQIGHAICEQLENIDANR